MSDLEDGTVEVEVTVEPDGDDSSDSTEQENVAAEAHAARAHDAEERADDAAEESEQNADVAEFNAEAAHQAASAAIDAQIQSEISNAQVMDEIRRIPDLVVTAMVAANAATQAQQQSEETTEIPADDAPEPDHWWLRDIREVFGKRKT